MDELKRLAEISARRDLALRLHIFDSTSWWIALVEVESDEAIALTATHTELDGALDEAFAVLEEMDLETCDNCEAPVLAGYHCAACDYKG